MPGLCSAQPLESADAIEAAIEAQQVRHSPALHHRRMHRVPGRQAERAEHEDSGLLHIGPSVGKTSSTTPSNASKLESGSLRLHDKLLSIGQVFEPIHCTRQRVIRHSMAAIKLV